MVVNNDLILVKDNNFVLQGEKLVKLFVELNRFGAYNRNTLGCIFTDELLLKIDNIKLPELCFVVESFD